jgi:uracil-DNA glycosylase
MDDLAALLAAVRGCAICEDLPLGPSPLVQVDRRARILIAGQAPGRLTHVKGIPFDDPSGNRLRDWMGIDRETFYDPARIAIVPMGFCYPGTGKGGDLPPRGECAPAWRSQLLERLDRIELTLVIGQYANAWHLGARRGATLTDTVADWRTNWPELLPLPHPSPRNNRWLKKNHWFGDDILPHLKARVRKILGQGNNSDR